jgi:gamma-glutamyltranspeptidase/glutathione hydrolase
MIEGNEVTGSRGVIAAGPPEVARVGGRIFEAGGNAMDAAAAACLACAVLQPQAADLGGYVAAGVLLDKATGTVWSIDANSVAAAAASEHMYEVMPRESGKLGINELEYGCSVRDDANVYGALSVGVPGFMAGIGTLWERWGRLPWAGIVAPAHALAKSALSYDLVRPAVHKKRDEIALFPSTAELLEERTWPGPGLASTLEQLARAGWRDFYDGQIGHTIADYVSAQGGILTRADMAAFSPRVTEPCITQYANAVVHTAIAPNGGFSVLTTLPDMPPGTEDADWWEHVARVLAAMWRRRLAVKDVGATPHGTEHVAAADAEGNLVSMTISQGGLFGSCLAVPGTGVILGHGMCRFDPHPGGPNSPGPRKRPLNNVCPLLIRMPGRDVAIGARGGRRIVSVALQFAYRIIHFGATAYDTASAPRMHALGDGPVEVSANFDPVIRAQLESRGLRIEVPEEVAGAAHGAEILKEGTLRAGGNTWAVGV